MKILSALAVLIAFNMPLLGQARYADISFSALFAAGAATVGGDDLLLLQPGAHDPRLRGFTVQNLEMSVKGAIDPFFNGEIHLIFQIDEEGESLMELEEAFLTSRNFPFGLQLRAGTYFTEFGRLNVQHPHAWAYVDQPLVNNAFLGGDGLRGPGARLSWLTPLPWYTELTAGLQNANGETAVSFLGEAEETTMWNYPLVDREVHTVGDLIRSLRVLNSLLINEETTANIGVSAAWGPNRLGVTGSTRILGADIYLKWQRSANDSGWPFATLQGEWIQKVVSSSPYDGIIPANIIFGPPDSEVGFYGQLQYGFLRGWVAGFRYEKTPEARVSRPTTSRSRMATNLTYYPSEFSKVRLQINRDDGEFLGEETIWGAWLQYEFLMGQHGGHKF